MNPVFDEKNRYIVSLNISEEKGIIKTPRNEVALNEEGIIGDAHSGKWHRQISMLAMEDDACYGRCGAVFTIGRERTKIFTR